jgi:hypothetical protein
MIEQAEEILEDVAEERQDLEDMADSLDLNPGDQDAMETEIAQQVVDDVVEALDYFADDVDLNDNSAGNHNLTNISLIM